MDDQSNDPQKKNRPKQLQNHNMPSEQIRENIYYSLTSCGLPKEQKRCHNGTQGRGEQLYIDQHILNKSKTRWKNVAMA